MLTDNFNRRFYYLRLSVTDACNFKCEYCLPDGYKCSSDESFLSLSEIAPLVNTFAQLGTRKIRLTGGEPALRKDIDDIIACCAQTPGIDTVAMTTNGFNLAKKAHHWQKLGLKRINISFDSLDPRQFNAITGTRCFNKVLEGVEAALDAGFESVKTNVVLTNKTDTQAYIAWVKERNLDVRFIELMETGDHNDYFHLNHISGQGLKQQLISEGWQKQITACDSGPAQVMGHPDYQGRIGLILPYEDGFCANCNRLRVSSRGKLHLCLFGEHGYDLRSHLHQDTLPAVIEEALQYKGSQHFLKEGNTGMTPHLASIGG